MARRWVFGRSESRRRSKGAGEDNVSWEGRERKDQSRVRGDEEGEWNDRGRADESEEEADEGEEGGYFPQDLQEVLK